MTTPMAWIRADKKSRKGKGRTMMEKRVIPFSPPDISELEINEVAEGNRQSWDNMTGGDGGRCKTRRLCLAQTSVQFLIFRIILPQILPAHVNNKGPLKEPPLYGFAYANRHYERFHLERIALDRNDEITTFLWGTSMNSMEQASASSCLSKLYLQ